MALAKPLAASIFLVINGLILLGAERFRRRAEVRALAAREGMNRDGGRRLDTLEYKEAGVIGFVQSFALIAGMSRDGICMATGLVRGLDNEDAARFAFLLATPPILAAGLFKFSDLTGSLGAGIRGDAVIAAVAAAITAVFTVHFLMRYFKTRNADPVRDLLHRVRDRDGHLQRLEARSRLSSRRSGPCHWSGPVPGPCRRARAA